MANKERKTKKRTYTVKHSKDMLKLALEALRKKCLSSYEAEKVFGIPRRTLLDKLHGKHLKAPGSPTKLTDEEEDGIIKVLIAAADFGSPLTLLDLRIVVHRYLEGNGRLSIFNNKLPGKKWAYSFIKRNKSKLTFRVIQNIKRARAEKNADEMKDYFTNLKTSLEGVPSANILNYDETNLTDNPGAQKCLFRRGVKYPERVLNYTKGAISIMFAITADGECLPPYVVYKAEHLYSQWTINGPKGSRFNRSKSGWFDSLLFEDWFENIILPWARNKPGQKVLVGDNLASHINYKIVKCCEQNDIRFVFLPPNSSHLTQPLDVCYFGPLKKLWREILLNYKIKNPREATIHKGHFPDLLKKLMEKLNDKKHNIVSGFQSTGIAPFNPDKVINKLPGSNQPTITYTVDNALLDWLKETRGPEPNKKLRNKKLNVQPGKSVCTEDFEHLVSPPIKTKPIKKNKRQKDHPQKISVNQQPMQETSDPLLKSPRMSYNPDSLKMLCIRTVNTQLIEYEQNTDPQVSVTNLGDISRNDEANMPFNDKMIPKCLQSQKSKIIVTSNIIVEPGTSQKIQQINSSSNKRNVIVTRPALHMELLPRQKGILAEQKEILIETTRHTNEELKEKTETIEKKKNVKLKNNKLKNEKEPSKQKKTSQKNKPVKKRKLRSSTESSIISDIEMSIADSADSEYETLEDFIKMYEKEEQENIEPSIPYGLSDIEYFTEDNKKLRPGSWILAKFVTKKSVKHYVGKILSIKNNIPEVKFLRKVKASKLSEGTVFTYPTVDDICIMKHLDDIISVLPEPNILRRGQVMFHIDLSNYNVQ